MVNAIVRWCRSSAFALAVAAAAVALSPSASPAKPERAVGQIIELPANAHLPKGARFVAPYATPADELASFALVELPRLAGAVGADFPVAPTFEKLPDGRHRVVVEMPAGTSFYGTGLSTGPLLRNGWEIELWNSDVPGYSLRNRSLYQSHPWVFAVRPDGSCVGLLLDSTYRAEISLDGAAVFTFQGPPAPLYVLRGDTPAQLCSALAGMTGKMPLPPRWALGYHQCRWSYNPEARVRQVAGEFRRRNIPASVFWFDIDYMDGFRTFTFDKGQFPDPRRLNEDMARQGWFRVWMINPGVKNEPGYFVRDQLIAGGHAVMAAGGVGPYIGNVWPGPCVFPDFTSPAARAWWGTLYKDFMAQGVSGVWNDMNEPAVFTSPTKLMPEDCLHAGGEYRPFPSSAPRTVTPGTHARFHNVYGMLMAQASFEGMLAANPDKRPFLLTRANFLGGHRYAATWTGDNSATWADLEQSIPMILNMGLSGQPFVGPDIGGFIGNGPADLTERADQFARWMGVGAFFPFCRGHAARDTINKEPWEFGPDAERATRLALQRRSRLIPYIYTLFREASVTGVPVMRPAFFADPTDPALRGEDDAFLLGGDLLVVPSLMPDHSRKPALPRGQWPEFDLLNERHPALPTMRIRPGAIIPAGPVAQFDDMKPIPMVTLVVALDAAGNAVGRLYEDAGDGFGYKSGDYLLSTYVARREGSTVTVSLAGTEGKLARPERRQVLVRLVLPDRVIENRGFDGQPVKITVPR